MSEAVAVAIIAPSILALIGGVLAWLVARQAAANTRRDKAEEARIRADEKKADDAVRRADRQHIEDREDQLSARAEYAALRAELVAREIVAANKHTAEVVEKSSGEVLEVANKTHDLVNSAMTTQKELTLTFAKTTLSALQAAAMKSPTRISREQQGEIDAVAAKVKELEDELEERARQQKVLDDQAHATALAAANTPTVVTFAHPQDVRIIRDESDPPRADE